jgi:ABC-type multidrug transport system ATPase subunit
MTSVLQTSVLQTSGLGKKYGRRWALRDCTLSIPEGKVVGLVGPNGAGKTTLLHLAVGLLAPTAGAITVLGGHPADGPAQILILDEPLASLDPLARREFLQNLMEVVAEHGVSVVLSSHLVADLERVCDYLVVLVASRVQLAGEVTALLASHHRLSGPRRDPGSLPASQQVIEESHTDKQRLFLVRTDEPMLDPAWTVKPVTLDDLVIAYMSQAREPRPRSDRLADVERRLGATPADVAAADPAAPLGGSGPMA